jgi:hypothetical protein
MNGKKGRGRKMAEVKKEKLQWVLTLFNTAGQLLDAAGKVGEKIPEKYKQRLPGFMGLSLEDERLFNEILTEPADMDDSVLINDFLAVCKDYEANRFRNIVAGMEIIKGTPKIIERKFDQKTKKTVDGKIIEEVPEKDRRRMFLKNFAEIIRTKFKCDYRAAYAYCIGGGLFVEDPLTAKVMRTWQKSCDWFKKIVLDPFSANSLTELKTKLNDNQALNDAAGWIETNINQKAPKYEGLKSGFPNGVCTLGFIIFVAAVVIVFAYGFLRC